MSTKKEMQRQLSVLCRALEGKMHSLDAAKGEIAKARYQLEALEHRVCPKARYQLEALEHRVCRDMADIRKAFKDAFDPPTKEDGT